MKNVILTPNPYRDRNFQTVRGALQILKDAGIRAVLCLPFDVDKNYELPKDLHFSRLERELPNAEAVICFGGDGVIVATPSGSTAYSLSAGGPIVEPDAHNIIVTPICAHDMVSRCIVASDRRVITVSMAQNARRNAYLSVDGGKATRLNMGDVATIRKSKYETKLLRLNDRSFYDVVNSKFQKN